MKDTAAKFFDACETGKGWESCKPFCHPNASFTAQADAFKDVQTLEAYTEEMKGLIAGPLPDASYELRSLAVDEDHSNVCGFAVFKGSNTGEGGPGAPTGKKVETDFVYVMQFDGDRISHMTKIWNDGFAMRQLGWA